jgi:hypothetical protein
MNLCNTPTTPALTRMNVPPEPDGAPSAATTPAPVALPPGSPASDPVEPPGHLTADALQAYSEMRPALRTLVLEINEMLRAEHVNLMRSRYALGQILAEIRRDPAAYGDTRHSYGQLRRFFGEGTLTIL